MQSVSVRHRIHRSTGIHQFDDLFVARLVMLGWQINSAAAKTPNNSRDDLACCRCIVDHVQYDGFHFLNQSAHRMYPEGFGLTFFGACISRRRSLLTTCELLSNGAAQVGGLAQLKGRRVSAGPSR